MDQKIVKRVKEIADKRGWKMSHVALAWINKRVASPIIGFSSVERIDKALEASGQGAHAGGRAISGGALRGEEGSGSSVIESFGIEGATTLTCRGL